MNAVAYELIKILSFYYIFEYKDPYDKKLRRYVGAVCTTFDLKKTDAEKEILFLETRSEANDDVKDDYDFLSEKNYIKITGKNNPLFKITAEGKNIVENYLDSNQGGKINIFKRLLRLILKILKKRF